MDWSFEKVKKFMQKLDINIKNEELWTQVYTTAGFANENQGYKNYEKLEHLGDRVWNLYIAQDVYNEHYDIKFKEYQKKFEDKVSNDYLKKISSNFCFTEIINMNKGEYQKKFEDKVSNDYLKKISSNFCFTEIINMNKGEYHQKQYHQKPASDIIESVVAAIYLEFGIEKCFSFIKKIINKYEQHAFSIS